jgi:hypothetical protein
MVVHYYDFCNSRIIIEVGWKKHFFSIKHKEWTQFHSKSLKINNTINTNTNTNTNINMNIDTTTKTYNTDTKTIKAVISFLKKVDMTTLPTAYGKVQKKLQYNVFFLCKSTVTVTMKEKPLKTKDTSQQ